MEKNTRKEKGAALPALLVCSPHFLLTYHLLAHIVTVYETFPCSQLHLLIMCNLARVLLCHWCRTGLWALSLASEVREEQFSDFSSQPCHLGQWRKAEPNSDFYSQLLLSQVIHKRQEWISDSSCQPRSPYWMEQGRSRTQTPFLAIPGQRCAFLIVITHDITSWFDLYFPNKQLY